MGNDTAAGPPNPHHCGGHCQYRPGENPLGKVPFSLRLRTADPNITQIYVVFDNCLDAVGNNCRAIENNCFATVNLTNSSDADYCVDYDTFLITKSSSPGCRGGNNKLNPALIISTTDSTFSNITEWREIHTSCSNEIFLGQQIGTQSGVTVTGTPLPLFIDQYCLGEDETICGALY